MITGYDGENGIVGRKAVEDIYMKVKMSVWVGELKTAEGVERPGKEQIRTIRIAVIKPSNC